MASRDESTADDGELAPPSKSARKRQMTALQELGESLAQLPAAELARIPIDDGRLRLAIEEVRGMHSRSARRRHLQYIGKLMREIDPEPMARALAELHRQSAHQAEAFHRLEALRDAVLESAEEGVEQVVREWPGADRQHLRALARQHQREVSRGKAPAASRKLFRYLRELAEGSGT